MCTVDSYAADEIHFNLMAFVSDRKRELGRRIAGLEEKRDQAALRVRGWNNISVVHI